jgi:hypothetical protein
MQSSIVFFRSFVPHAVLSGLLLLVSAGCGKNAPPGTASAEPDATPVSSAGSASVPTEAGSTAALAPADSIALATGLDSLIGRLSREARDRPKVQPTAEDVLAKLETLGERISTKQQSLADTYKANYCLGGYTVDGLFALSACEYADAAAAVAGRDLSKKILSHVTTRDVWAHKATTLAIVQLKADPATDAQKKKLVAAFLAM